MYALLYFIRGQRGLVVEDDVVRRLYGALETGVRLEVEVEVLDGGHAFVDDGAWERVAVLVGVLRIGREEPRVVALAADDDAQLRVVLGVLGIDCCECLEDLRQLILEDLVVLALDDNILIITTIVKDINESYLRYAITEDNHTLRQGI